MATSRLFVIAAAAALAAGVSAGDVFDFIPHGGRTMLDQVLHGKAAPAEVQALLAAKHTREEWTAYLRGHAAQLPPVQKLSDKELQTLADYMAFNLPLAPGKPLPWDGRDMALEKCQGCHIITVVVTQNRTKEAWLGTMGKPSHVMIRLTREQREQLANYLVLNAGIPIDDVPPELRAGGASY